MSGNEDTRDKNMPTRAEDTEKKDEYEKVCFICHRPESVAGKMIDLPNHISVCADCMQRSFDAMNNGGFDYSQFMNMPGNPMMGFGDAENQMPKSQRVKKKKPEEKAEPVFDIHNIPAPHKISIMINWYN